jgi:hypothetical protein
MERNDPLGLKSGTKKVRREKNCRFLMEIMECSWYDKKLN